MVLYVVLNNSEERKYLECVVADSNKDVSKYCSNKYGEEYHIIPIFYGSESNLTHIENNEGNDIKTKQEIYDEIEATKRTIKNYRNAFAEDRIDRKTLKAQIADCSATIDALEWVLEKNNRYD